MGGVTHGTLKLSDGTSYEGCSPSIVWSDDSRYLAAPQLSSYMRQQLLVIVVSENRSGYAPGYFGPLELHTFSGGVIRGLESPGSSDERAIEIDVSQIRWE